MEKNTKIELVTKNYVKNDYKKRLKRHRQKHQHKYGIKKRETKITTHIHNNSIFGSIDDTINGGEKYLNILENRYIDEKNNLSIAPTIPPTIQDINYETIIEELLYKCSRIKQYEYQKETLVEILKNVHNHKKSLSIIVSPTGTGKSQIYQYLLNQVYGTGIIISPQISQMEDQYRRMCEMNISCAVWNSTTSYDKILELQIKLQDPLSPLQLLFVSPERILNNDFITIIQKSTAISFICVDEIHCLTEWSQWFRPSYLRSQYILSKVLLYKKDSSAVVCTCPLHYTNILQPCTCKPLLPPIIGQTATATKSIIDTITTLVSTIYPYDEFYLYKSKDILPDNLLQTSSILLNTSSECIEICTILQELHNKLHITQGILIYVPTRQECEKITQELILRGYDKVQAYHAGLSLSIRQTIQSNFYNNDIHILISTMAFGMGIDKSDIRVIIHVGAPDTLEQYIQEIGRAGRNKSLALCHTQQKEEWKTSSFETRSGIYIERHTIQQCLLHCLNLRDEWIYAQLSWMSNDIVPTHNDVKYIWRSQESIEEQYGIQSNILDTIMNQQEIESCGNIEIIGIFRDEITIYFDNTLPKISLNTTVYEVWEESPINLSLCDLSNTLDSTIEIVAKYVKKQLNNKNIKNIEWGPVGICIYTNKKIYIENIITLNEKIYKNFFLQDSLIEYRKNSCIEFFTKLYKYTPTISETFLYWNKVINTLPIIAKTLDIGTDVKDILIDDDTINSDAIDISLLSIDYKIDIKNLTNTLQLSQEDTREYLLKYFLKSASTIELEPIKIVYNSLITKEINTIVILWTVSLTLKEIKSIKILEIVKDCIKEYIQPNIQIQISTIVEYIKDTKWYMICDIYDKIQQYTPTTVAKLLYGISSTLFPKDISNKFLNWGHFRQTNFYQLVDICANAMVQILCDEGIFKRCDAYEAYCIHLNV